MNPNTEAYFATNPTNIDIRRSRFDRSFGHKTSFNAGELIPTYFEEVLPGDTFDVSTAALVRSSTPIHPVMDNAYFETKFFFVPRRLTWIHNNEFFGENNTGPWTQTHEYTTPQLILSDAIKDDLSGSLVDYFGLPVRVNYGGKSLSVDALPFRAYVKIFNDWFRDENVMAPAYFYDGDSDIYAKPRWDVTDPDDPVDMTPAQAMNNALYGARPLQVSKFHDYFTSSLPAPQKGDPVSVPVSGFFGQRVPVTTPFDEVTSKYEGLSWQENADSGAYDDGAPLLVSTGSNAGTIADLNNELDFTDMYPTNLGLDAGQLSILVNDMRLAFQLQKWSEAAARGGTRYIEILHSMFGVTSPDARQQRSEYLGGFRVPLSQTQVVQTSSTDATSPQGNVAAYSKTGLYKNGFIKSFTEHGFIIGLSFVRTDQSYQQVVDRKWCRQRKFQFYWPQLANIGEQAILRKERFVPSDWTDIFDAQSTDQTEAAMEGAFGYQEAWAEYRYHPSYVTGNFRSNSSSSLDIWTYTNDFKDTEDEVTAVINQDFVWETSENVDRTLAVTSKLSHQFFADIEFRNLVTRPMPVRSIPGLVDHH